MPQQIVINNLLINYYEFCKGDKQNVIFLHGWRSQSLVWQQIADRLKSEGYTIYALDLPGFGSSAAPDSAYTVGDYKEIVRCFIDKLELTNNIVVGHSFGGRVGIKLAAENPDLVQKLILVDSAGLRLEDEIRSNNLKKVIAKAVKPVFGLKIMSGLKSYIYKKIGSEDYLATPSLRETYVNVINEDLRPFLPMIKASTLIIWGDKDTDTPLEYADIMHKEIAQSRLEILEGAGHFSFVDCPDKFTDLLNNFIKS